VAVGVLAHLLHLVLRHGFRMRYAVEQIIVDAQPKQRRFLLDVTDLLLQSIHIQINDIVLVQRDCALGNIVEPLQQRHHLVNFTMDICL